MRIDPQILAEAANRFGLELSSLRPLGGMEGMALEFKRGDSLFVLKITPKDKSDSDQIHQTEARFEFMTYLAENGVRVAKPVPSPAGKVVETVETTDKIYLVFASTKAAGRHINLSNPYHAKPGFFQAWGQVTGQMHRLATAYPSWRKYPDDGRPPSPMIDWVQEYEFFKNWCQHDGVRGKWVQLGTEIATLPQTRAGYGLIHNDLHPWNFLVDDHGQITVIDFDVCSYHFFVKDLAIALFFANWNGNPGMGRSKDDYLTEFFQNFMQGYAREYELEAFWFRQIPTFLKHHQILLFTVFTDEWKTPNRWQANTLQKWKRQILNDIPVVRMQF
jgi:Ser/Thr protein kinase RdoA (MazF antagonist)